MITLKKEVKVSGNGLMKNKTCEVTIFPSEAGKIRYFVKGQESFDANIDSVLATDHCVVLGNKNSKAMLTEHLTAALAFCEIDSADICMSEEEVPILDGSSKLWVEAFKKVGTTKPIFSKEKHYTVSEPVYYLNGKTSLVILPDKELFISYAVNYNHTGLQRRFVNFDPKNKDEIIAARTFGFYHDLKKYQMLGFAQGANIDNTLGFMDDGTYTTELRSENEPIKHKMLDLIGDLYLTGINPLKLNCQILAKEAGHAVHVKVAKILKDKLIEI
ncbi:UDP-3-O-acyl-N-acetylglucosamine deacetylase [bacterium]|nr:UDP-3-O-acyl-N-acetylglucosamine deacetylase [Alphaproteobacteria bacterium]MBR1425547.1 UDP-3-O-acyl-N-acetylglucosamine deacetylase [bacterium]